MNGSPEWVILGVYGFGVVATWVLLSLAMGNDKSGGEPIPIPIPMFIILTAIVWPALVSLLVLVLVGWLLTVVSRALGKWGSKNERATREGGRK